MKTIKRAGKGQAKGRQRATTKESIIITSNNNTEEGKKERSNNILSDIISRKQVFYDSLIPFLDSFSKETIREFFEYWTEHGPTDKKMRFEKESSFGISRRLATWKRNESKFNNGTTKNNSASEQLDEAKRDMAARIAEAFGEQEGSEPRIPDNDFGGNGKGDAYTG